MIWALHGAFGSPRDWDELRIKGMNLRTVELWESVADYHSWSAGLVAKVRAEGDPSPSLMGYSMGARIAMHALIDAPSVWTSAILVSGHPGLVTEEERRAQSKRDIGWAKRVRAEAIGDLVEDWQAQEVFGGRAREIDVEYLEAHREAVAASFEDWSLARQAPLWARLASVTCPVLWITGRDDEKYTELGRRAVAGMPDARHVIMDGCGHRVPWEDADGFAREILRFQNEVAMGG